LQSSFFLPRAQAAAAWPRIPTPEASQVWSAYLALDRTQWLEPDQIEQQQLAQLRTLLGHAVRNVPYYRRLLAAAGIAPDQIQTMEDFRRIPILARRTYQEEFLQMYAGSLPAGTVQTGKAHTSGTSGVPVEVRQTNVSSMWWLAFTLRDLEWCGIDPRGTLASIRATGLKGAELDRMLEGLTLPSWGKQLAGVVETGTSHAMDIHQDPRRQLEWLRQIEPDYLLSFPSNLGFLAGLIAESGRPLNGLRAIQSIAETLTDEMRARIESAFGVPVKNTYSSFEAGYLASPCPDGPGLHIHSENVILEVLDDRDHPCEPGATGRVVVTTLHNFLTPFIRYEIIDEGEVGPPKCPCGRGLPALSCVAGRRHPFFVLPDGRQKISTALVVGVRGIGGTHQFQIVQRAADHVAVRVVPNREWTDEHGRRITRIMHEYFEHPVRVDVELLPRFDLPRGGKLRVVESELQSASPQHVITKS
jgi:phenylacetate-CoA ligase